MLNHHFTMTYELKSEAKNNLPSFMKTLYNLAQKEKFNLSNLNTYPKHQNGPINLKKVELNSL
jgi:hypothetical protein